MDLSSIAPVAISVLALGVTIHHGWATRRHNRLMVTPNLTVTTTMSHKSPQFVAEIVNTGVGPAIIKKFSVFLDDKEYKRFEAVMWLALTDLLDLPKEARVKGLAIDAGQFIPAGRQFPLLEYRCEGEEITTKRLRQQFRRIKVEIDYESVYGERFQTSLQQEISLFDCIEGDM